MTDTDRLAALERRVTDLEARLQPPEPADAGAVTADSEVFWALEGLRARVEEPGAVLLAGHVRLPDGRHAQWQQAAATEDLVDGDWVQSAEALAALGHPVRLRLLQQVLAGATTVQELTLIEGMGTSGQVYHHLRQLTSTGWLRGLGGGRYEVPVARIVPLLVLLVGAQR